MIWVYLKYSLGENEDNRQGAECREEKMELQKDFQTEQAHFKECLELIRYNVAGYEKEYDIRHQESQELMRAMKSGDPELYNQAMTSASLEEHAAAQLRKNRAALKQPYFGRIDYQEGDREREEQVYIGKNGISRNQTDVVIADWRAPISTVYYENELGSGCYYLPDGSSVDIRLDLKRTYDVQDGELRGFYDSDVASNDQLLIQYLSQNKEAVLGDIIATIQKEQNEIIRQTPFANILVQGVAGSGKTTVAMHRISYILYNYKERFMSNEFCIIGGNDLLLNYITAGLPELDVPDIKQKRMDVMLAHLLGKEWTKKQKVIPVTEDGRVRSSMDFMLDLEIWLLRLRETFCSGGPLVDHQLGTVISQSSKERLFMENPDFSVARLLRTLDDRVKTRLKFLAPEGEKEYLQKKYKQYKDYYKNRQPKESIYDFYGTFLQEYERKHPGSLNLTVHQQNAAANQYDVYDLAALLVIQYRITRKKEDEEFGQLFIDEAQDFGITPYYALRRVLPKCYFTIMGDVSQNIDYECGMNDWQELRKWVLTGEKDVFRLLSKSYRNTIEISEYAGTILEKASFGRYKIEPVIRHGLPVQVSEPLTEEQMYAKAEEIIVQAHEKGYESIAVICRDDREADWVSKWLEGVTVLPIHLTKGLEFDVVILWKPDLEAALASQKDAKLWYVAVTRALHELHLLNLKA